jgi:hypothetical protein
VVALGRDGEEVRRRLRQASGRAFTERDGALDLNLR